MCSVSIVYWFQCFLFSFQSIALWELIILWSILSVKAACLDSIRMKKGSLSANSVQLGLTPSISIQEASWNAKVMI